MGVSSAVPLMFYHFFPDLDILNPNSRAGFVVIL
jgi:hypothetical protein